MLSGFRVLHILKLDDTWSINWLHLTASSSCVSRLRDPTNGACMQLEREPCNLGFYCGLLEVI